MHVSEHVWGLNIVINICKAMHVHLFFVNYSSVLHLRFLVHDKHLFHICPYSLHTSLLVMQTIMDANNNITFDEVEGWITSIAFKKQKIQKTIYPNEAHKGLLNVCGFTDIFKSARICNFDGSQWICDKACEQAHWIWKETKSLPCQGEINKDAKLLAFFVSIKT